ncbi:MAG TPA: hypothetical protein VFP89_01465 [Propionibacteriaceae bacterium]|nr:hypothetical protein [Propionibacteriaceae bacterium]
MFVQVIQGKVSDPAKVKAAFDRWIEELSPGAQGWLGSTTGVTDDGRCITLARFASEEEARRNSDRPEQGEWWSETSALFDGDVTFRESTEVDVDLEGDPDQAGFVQVMQGRVSDPDRARELMNQNPEKWRALRTDILGTVTAAHDGGEWTTAAYFTSEAAAREGESKQPPPELQALMEEMNSLNVGEVEYFDIRQPLLYSPRQT